MRRALIASILLAGVAAHADDSAKPKKKLHWEEGRRRFTIPEYIATGILGPLAVAEYFVVQPQVPPHWTGGILFDDALRNAIRLRDPRALSASWAMADTVGTMLVLVNVALDSVIIPLARKSPDVAWQLLMMDAESYTLSSLVAISAYDTIGRARPPYVDCQKSTGSVPSSECYGSLTASFPSGHTALGFNAAGLSCAHHLFQHVYGNRAADVFGCVRDLTLATTEAVLRMMGDRHYFSDVIAGSLIGFSSGFALPTLLHYAKWKHRIVALPMAGPHQAGVSFGGAF
ncbi:MAG TPA: phosphatase PAP2 family protein [Polyangiaceae bacterium]|nr:phosphatase PAP2 family protein [Polyangiaceae bacterium]